MKERTGSVMGSRFGSGSLCCATIRGTVVPQEVTGPYFRGGASPIFSGIQFCFSLREYPFAVA